MRPGFDDVDTSLELEAAAPPLVAAGFLDGGILTRGVDFGRRRTPRPLASDEVQEVKNLRPPSGYSLWPSGKTLSLKFRFVTKARVRNPVVTFLDRQKRESAKTVFKDPEISETVLGGRRGRLGL